MGPEGVSDEMGGVTNGKVLAFGGVEVQLPTLNIMAVTGGGRLLTRGWASH